MRPQTALKKPQQKQQQLWWWRSGSADVRRVEVCRVREWLVEVSRYVYRIERDEDDTASRQASKQAGVIVKSVI